MLRKERVIGEVFRGDKEESPRAIEISPHAIFNICALDLIAILHLNKVLTFPKLVLCIFLFLAPNSWILYKIE